MIKLYQNRLKSVKFDQGFETKQGVKRESVTREFDLLSVPVKHLQIGSVCSNCEMVRMFDPLLRDRTQFVESNNYLFGGDLNVSLCNRC
jgi:hypothetical protein